MPYNLDSNNALLDEEEFDTDYNYELFRQTMANIRAGVEAGVISPDDGEYYEANALEELQERLADDLDLETEDYSDGSDLATFNVGSRFGAALLELGEAAGYEDAEDFIYDLAEATGNDPDDIVALIEGDIAPDDELAMGIGDLFELDDELAGDLLLAGMEARGEDYENIDNEYEEDEEEDEEEDKEVGAQYSAYGHRVRDLENQIAEFQISDAVKNELSQIELRAGELVQNGCMPPVAMQTLLGSFDLETDRLAAFSTVCDRNGVDLDTELYAMKKTLEVFERMGPIVSFGQMVQEPISEYEMNEDMAVEEQALRNIQTRIREKHNLA